MMAMLGHLLVAPVVLPLLSAAAPQVRRVGVLMNSANPANGFFFDALRARAKSLGLQVERPAAGGIGLEKGVDLAEREGEISLGQGAFHAAQWTFRQPEIAPQKEGGEAENDHEGAQHPASAARGPGRFWGGRSRPLGFVHRAASRGARWGREHLGRSPITQCTPKLLVIEWTGWEQAMGRCVERGRFVLASRPELGSDHAGL